MKKFIFSILVICLLSGCSENRPVGQYPVIDVGSSVGDYKRAYLSEYFSPIELVALETSDVSLVGGGPNVFFRDSFIFVSSLTTTRVIPEQRNILVFNRNGKFLNKIGALGRGPGEYIGINNIFFSHERQTIYVFDGFNIFEYEFCGLFIRSFPVPVVDGQGLWNVSCVEDDVFVGSFLSGYLENLEYKYCLFDNNGEIIKCFPNNYYTDNMTTGNSWVISSTFASFKIDDKLYLKDNINDTLYTLVNMDLQPMFVFDFGKYSYPLGKINEEGKREILTINNAEADNLYMRIIEIVGTPNHFFYSLYTARIAPGPESRPNIDPNFPRAQRPGRETVYAVYCIATNSNKILDSDQFLQKGLINDINGGLSFFPRYYAGDGIVVDVWQAEDMKEILTEEYFASVEIKDAAAHQKLREILKNLDWEDNPVVVIARLK